MRYTIIIYDTDTEYANRLRDYFLSEHTEDAELILPEGFGLNRAADAMLVSADFFDYGYEVPTGIPCFVLTERKDVEEICGYPAVFKFRDAEAIYKELIKMIVEFGRYTYKVEKKDRPGAITLFTQAAGGVGTSTVASAFAMQRVQLGRSVIYLELSPFVGADSIFETSNRSDFQEVLYAVKSRKNLSMRLKPLIEKDISGVELFGGCKNPYELSELAERDIRDLLETLKTELAYDEIIVDVPAEFIGVPACCMEVADRIILVSDGSTRAEKKNEALVQGIRTMDLVRGSACEKKVEYLQNRVPSGKTERIPTHVRYICKEIAGEDGRRVAELLSMDDCFAA